MFGLRFLYLLIGLHLSFTCKDNYCKDEEERSNTIFRLLTYTNLVYKICWNILYSFYKFQIFTLNTFLLEILEEREEADEMPKQSQSDESVQEEHTFSFVLDGELHCKEDFNCAEDASVNFIIKATAFWNAKNAKKMVLISAGPGKSPGMGWYFSMAPTYTNKGNDRYLAPIAWKYIHTVDFNDDGEKVVITKIDPRNKPEKSANVAFVQSFDTAQSLSGFIVPSKTPKVKTGAIRVFDRAQNPFPTGIKAGFDWTKETSTAIYNSYSVAAGEYEVVSAGATSFASVKYTREFVDHNVIMYHGNETSCGDYPWQIGVLGSQAYAGFLPALSVSIEVDYDYTKPTIIQWDASVELTKLKGYWTGSCGDSMSFQGVYDRKTYTFTKYLKINWAHPMFQPFLMNLIQLYGYEPVPKVDVCMEANVDDKAADKKVIELRNCYRMDNENVYAWILVERRFHWFSKELNEDYCLSSDIANIRSLFVEPCRLNSTQQWWYLSDYYFSNNEGFAFVDRTTNQPVISVDDKDKWLFPTARIASIDDAFEVVNGF